MERKIANTKNSVSRLITSFIVLCFTLLNYNGMAKTGQELFKSNCITCHTIGEKKLVGPGLKGLLDRRTPEWVAKWISNSQALIQEGDSAAVALFKEYNETMMPSYSFSEEEMTGLIKFIDENQEADKPAIASTSNISTSTTDESKGINLTAIFWGVLFITLAIFFTYRFKKKVWREVNSVGVHEDPHYIKNYPLLFVVYVAIALAVIYIIVELLRAM